MLTTEKRDEILASFRKHGPIFAEVARETGCADNTARRMWFKGWPKRNWPPAKDVLAGEGISARAQMAPVVVQTEKAIVRDAIDSRAEEAKGVRMARVNAQALMGACSNLLAGFHPVAGALKRQLEQLARGTELDIQQALAAGRQIALMTRSAVLVAQTAMEMERLALGEPTEVIQHKHTVSDLTPDEVIARLDAARQAILDVQGDKLRLVHATDVTPAPIAKSG